jgi:hypothetical protein
MNENYERTIQWIRDYLVSNRTELLNSPLQVEHSDERYNERKDFLNFCKGGLPITLEAFMVIGMGVCYIRNPHVGLFVADIITVADIISREKGVKETNTLGYGLVGRIRDAYKTLSKNYSKKQ